MEREGQIIACAALFPFLEEKCGEVAAIAVSSDCQGQGQGDKLLGISFYTFYYLNCGVKWQFFILVVLVYRLKSPITCVTIMHIP